MFVANIYIYIYPNFLMTFFDFFQAQVSIRLKGSARKPLYIMKKIITHSSLILDG